MSPQAEQCNLSVFSAEGNGSANSKATKRLRKETWKNKKFHTWECWAPTPAAAPFGPLKTIGTDIWPADM